MTLPVDGMTKAAAVAMFIEHYLPGVRLKHESHDGRPDWPARWQAWNDFKDSLCKQGLITESQNDRWVQPKICAGPHRR